MNYKSHKSFWELKCVHKFSILWRTFSVRSRHQTHAHCSPKRINSLYCKARANAIINTWIILEGSVINQTTSIRGHQNVIDYLSRSITKKKCLKRFECSNYFPWLSRPIFSIPIIIDIGQNQFSWINTWFERISMMAILINCITLGSYQPCYDTKCESNR